MYELIFKKPAEKFYKKLDVLNKRRLNKVFDSMTENGLNNLDCRSLQGQYKGLYRIRIGDIRIIIFLKEKQVIEILTINYRGNAYK